jgi:phosphatidylserine/phosphatidylglycerophosphate/cardiolipin synthase-like enzyme
MKFLEASIPATPPSKRLKVEHPTTSGTMEMNQMVVDLTESPPSSPLLTLPASSNPIRVAKSKQPPTYMGPKKLVIKNLRSVPRADPNQYFDQVWKQLEAALSSIFRGSVVPYSLEDLYKGVETLCRQDRGPLLYKRLAEKCKNELTLLLKDPLVEEANSMEDSGVLRAVVDAWSVWNAQLVS